jgi:4'-phosphopantetheinyl transferase
MEFSWPAVGAFGFPELAADEAHAWAVPLNRAPPVDERHAILSPSERRRAGRFRGDEPRARFTIGRSALRILLGRYLGISPAEIGLTDDLQGKPRLADPNGLAPLRFNLAHSGELALVAVTAGCDVGIDVERHRVVSHWEEIAHRYFHAAEARALFTSTAAQRPAAFLRCWTAKEAVLKAIGVGLSGSLGGFQVRVDQLAGQWVLVPSGGAATPSHVWLQPLAPHGDYVAAVALAGEKRPIRCFAFCW